MCLGLGWKVEECLLKESREESNGEEPRVGIGGKMISE
jgi:hypothetical protein